MKMSNKKINKIEEKKAKIMQALKAEKKKIKEKKKLIIGDAFLRLLKSGFYEEKHIKKILERSNAKAADFKLFNLVKGAEKIN